MAVRFGDSIVTKGLVLYLNAASQKNYVLSEVEVLVVAGGGAGGGYGGNDGAGGGGAGGLIYSSSYSVTPGSAITATVGNGGSGVGGAVRGSSGQNSLFGVLTAIGGGGGGSEGAADQRPGGSGGSGGGAGGYGVNPGGAGTFGQGNKGGDCTAPGDGGGGGAGAVGQNGRTGTGGIGLLFNISGTPTYYAGGGGASGDKRNVRGGSGALGGFGGGGKGQDATNSIPPGNGTNGLGGGGGAAAGSNPTFGAGTTLTSGAGGSGVVIVRYSGPQKATGGTITQVGGFTIHTFTTSGTFTPLVAPINAGAIYGLQDLSGNGIIVNQSGGVTYSTSNRGSLSFDGTNDVVNGDTTLIDRSNGQEITVSCWIRPSRTSGQYSVFCTNRSNNTSLYNWIFYQHITDGAIAFHGIAQNKSTYIPTINVWINVTNTVTASGVSTLYVNGISTYVVNGFTYGNSTSIGRLGIGADPGGQEPFQGNIAQVSIYDRALTSAEIQQNFNAQRGRFGI